MALCVRDYERVVCVHDFYVSIPQARARDAQERLDALKDQLQGISLAEVSNKKKTMSGVS